jgi:hypothetical protein
MPCRRHKRGEVSPARTRSATGRAGCQHQALRQAFDAYVSAACRTAGGTRGGSRSRSSRTGAGPARDYDPKAVRVWAESRGIEVSQRGRVPADLVAKFQAANA